MEQQKTKSINGDLFFLAGLIHDIGKFWQRADKGFHHNDNKLSNYSKRLANDICPINEYGSFGYQHVLWSNEFLNTFRIKIEQIPGLKENLYKPDGFGENNIYNFAANHHLPQTLEQAIITLADWWSAGIDRSMTSTLEKEDGDSEMISWGKDRYRSIPLYSIFNRINDGSHNFAFPLKKLDIREKQNIFPKKVSCKQDGVSELEYRKLWSEFSDEIDKLPTDSIKGFIESFLFLLKKYTWCIPSNTMDMADVSLYEHLKTTAAFAGCIFRYYQANSDDLKWDPVRKKLSLKSETYPVLLLGGDVSGIQKFIYNIASRKAAMSLKGRSFYIQLLVDSVIQKIISHTDIDANLGHVIYASGGKFYMLLPNTDSVLQAIAEIRKLIDKELWIQHKGKLVFNMDFVPFSYSQNNIQYNKEVNKNIGDLWKTLADKLSQQKNQKFHSLLIENYQQFFNVLPDGGDVSVCAVTGENLNKKEAQIIDKTASEKTTVSDRVLEQINLGKALKDADFNIMYKGHLEDNKYLSKRASFTITATDIGNHLFKKTELIKNTDDFKGITSADVSRVTMINKTDFLSTPLAGKNTSYGYQFYGGNKQAMINENTYKDFEKLTQINPGLEGSATYLGVLRMDVDNLGGIFIKGLEEKSKSFSAYATLSFLLDLFFSGYLNTIRDDYKETDSKSGIEFYKYRDWVNILYSGGDDVFAVGRWDKIISFAEDIRNQFAAFVGRHDISLSAGIAIINNKFPIAKSAEIAGTAERLSKEYSDITVKNAITFLGETISWQNEFAYVKEKKQTFINLIVESGMSKAILHRIMLYAAIKKDNDLKIKDNVDFKANLSYKWHTAYYLKKFMNRFEKNKDIISFIKGLQIELLKPRNYDLISLAARWAELELKTKKQNLTLI